MSQKGKKPQTSTAQDTTTKNATATKPSHKASDDCTDTNFDVNEFFDFSAEGSLWVGVGEQVS